MVNYAVAQSIHTVRRRPNPCGCERIILHYTLHALPVGEATECRLPLSPQETCGSDESTANCYVRGRRSARRGWQPGDPDTWGKKKKPVPMPGRTTDSWAREMAIAGGKTGRVFSCGDG